MDCEVLIDDRMAARGQKMLDALIAAAPAAGVNVFVSKVWRGAAPVLMSYGLGHPVRREWTRRHRARGGRLVGWDLGYWNRDEPLRFSMRLTLDDDHPQRWIRPEPAARFDGAGIGLREDADPAGHVLLCGLGPKQRVHKGLGYQQWELQALKDLRRRFPGRRIVYRPKKPEGPLARCPTSSGAIESALKGAALVVCRHSNVAVDACIAGVPVECDDGAAFALYRDNPQPSREQRLEFLRSLAWWQWNPTEASQAWTYIRERLCA